MIVGIYMLRLRQDGIGTVGALWERSGSAVEALWERCGSAVGALWEHCGSAGGGAKHHPERQKMCFSNTFAIGFCQPQNDRTKNGSRRSKNISLSASCPREGKRTFFQNPKKNVYTPFDFWLLSEARTHAHQESCGTFPRLVFPGECTTKSQVCLKKYVSGSKKLDKKYQTPGFCRF